MSIAQIEAELNALTVEELRHLALRTWAAFVEKERADPTVNVCEEADPAVTAALDDAVQRVDRSGGRGMSGNEVRAKISRWITK